MAETKQDQLTPLRSLGTLLALTGTGVGIWAGVVENGYLLGSAALVTLLAVFLTGGDW